MIKVLLEAPILTQSGYGEHARLVYKSLVSQKDIEIFINPLVWGKTPWISETKDPLFKKIDMDIAKMQAYASDCRDKNKQLQFDIQVHVGIPSEFQKRAPYSVHVTAGIETDRVSANWLMKTSKGIDKIIVPSNHSRAGLVNTRYEVINKNTREASILYCASDVTVVPYPVKTVEPSNLDFSTSTDFNFLSIAMLGPRKNIQNTIKWFCEEFKDENVGLILKTSISSGGPMDKESTLNAINRAIPEGERKCKVYLLHGNLEESEVQSLYNREDIHAYVTATHGEGYGLPVFEAACAGMPIIATDWSAHTEFLSAPLKEGGKVKTKKLFAKVDYELKEIPKTAIWKDVLIEGSKWAYPKERSFKEQMRKVYKNYGMYKKWAEVLKLKVVEDFAEDKVLKKMSHSILQDGYLDGFVPYAKSNTREEMIKNWRMKVGE